jgi:tripartite-type tricarboxylate transporter receptor subunit TctC
MKRWALYAFVLSLIMSGAALAQSFPAKPIKIIVPSAAGSAPDILTRIFAAKLQERLGQPVIAENKPGAGGSLGADQVAKSVPDGYTLVMGNIGSHAMNVGIYPDLPYSPTKNFEAVAMVGVTPSLMSVSAELPIRTVEDFLTYARAQGDNVTFSSGGNGSSSHLAGEYLNLIAGLKMRHVPYKDVAQALGDVAAQRITVMISNMPPAMSLVRAGKLRPLAVTTVARSKALPDVPSISEGGLQFEQTVWFGLFAPAGTPASVVAALNEATADVLADAAVIEKFATSGSSVMIMTPPQLAAFVGSEIEKWSRVAKQSGAKAD